MSSFLEKLKKGMGVEDLDPQTNEEEVQTEEDLQVPDFKKEKIDEPEKEVKEKPQKTKKTKLLKEDKENITVLEKEIKKWPEPEGQLAVDIYQTNGELVIQSAVAGVKPEQIEITAHGDVITIKGERKKPDDEKGNYFSQECFWGSFSREIILPVEADASRAEASMTEGVLTIRMPKIEKDKNKKIIIKK